MWWLEEATEGGGAGSMGTCVSCVFLFVSFRSGGAYMAALLVLKKRAQATRYVIDTSIFVHSGIDRLRSGVVRLWYSTTFDPPVSRIIDWGRFVRALTIVEYHIYIHICVYNGAP